MYQDDYSESLGSFFIQTGQADAQGIMLTTNSKAGGRYHSNWLNMMYPRLRLARDLLREDGVIFVSIDDNEVHHLRMVMNEVFGEESFLACFIWHRRQNPDSRNVDRASTDHEYILSYRNSKGVLRGKDIDKSKYSNPDRDPRGDWFSADLTGLATKGRRPNLHYDVVNPETGFVHHPSPTRGWSVAKEKFQRYIEQGLILWPSKPDGRPRFKKFLKDVTSFQTGFSSMLKVGFTTAGTREIQDLFGEKVIQFPKPVGLIKTLVQQGAPEDGIILDFFAGSCTTAQAVLDLNRDDGGDRQFIMVQLPEPTENEQFPTIAEIGRERIRRVIRRMQSDEDEQPPLDNADSLNNLGFKCYRLDRSNFKVWEDYEGEDVAAAQNLFDQFETPLVEEWKETDLLVEILLVEGFPLNSEVTQQHGFGQNKVHLVESVFCEHRLFVCLDQTIEDDTIQRLVMLPQDVFVCLDSALTDQSKMQLADRYNVHTI